MIKIKNKQIIVNDKPTIIMCGEIHYYRLKRCQWQDRINKLKKAGCNAIAFYIPWICHEEEEGTIDFSGKNREELDLEAFINLCEENELMCFVRPGPFIMAEMKNEGLPYWLYEKYPEIIPIGWDGKKATTKTVDYLAPNFLNAVKKWYKAVMQIVTPHLVTNGGNIFAIQLDNEVGMLSWVSNCPDLTENLVLDFKEWLFETYENDKLKLRYDIDFENDKGFIDAIRTPKDSYSAELLHDLGYYMRYRFARYIKILRSYAEEFGAKEIPFVVNIHGTGGGRGFTYPIGISQLYESYNSDNSYISGSDIYFGNLTMDNFQDLYLANAFTDSVNNDDQPLTSVEFECGDGNYGDIFGARYDVSAADLKTRMCIAQGNRLLNYYLFAGGTNYVMDDEYKDGNGRVAHTGEKHGIAAPISPDGTLNYTYNRMESSIKTMMAVKDKIATMNEERDNVAIAFIPDYFMTEYVYPDSEKVKNMVNNITAHRAYGSWEVMVRAMLLNGYRFGALDIQNKDIDINKNPVITMSTSRYLSKEIQLKLVNYLNLGGKVLLYGELPQFDMEGNDCTILVDAMKVNIKETKYSNEEYYLSIKGLSWLSDRKEIRSHFAQIIELTKGKDLLKLCGSNDICGAEVEVGLGKIITINTAYSCDLEMFNRILHVLGAKEALKHNCKEQGIFMTSSANKDKEKIIHVLNLDGFCKQFNIFENGEVLLEGKKIVLDSKRGIMIPINLNVFGGKLIYSTAEIMDIREREIDFRLTQESDVIVFEDNIKIKTSEDYKIELKNKKIYIISNKNGKIHEGLTIKLK